MAISFSRPDPSSPTAVADANFPTARRGFDQQEVREFLRKVAAELARMQDRERFLEHELRTMRQQRTTVPAELDDAAVARLLGEETTRIVQAARESSTAIRSKAEDAAERLLSEAKEEAQALRQAAEQDASRRRKDAETDADAELTMAKQQGREMVEEARAYRERALGELARRRDLARQQIDQLVHGRDRLVQAFERARLVAADVVAELVPLGELDEYVNLSPTTGPVPVMVPASRLADASAISDDALALRAKRDPDDPALEAEPDRGPAAGAPAPDATASIDRMLADDRQASPAEVIDQGPEDHGAAILESADDTVVTTHVADGDAPPDGRATRPSKDSGAGPTLNAPPEIGAPTPIFGATVLQFPGSGSRGDFSTTDEMADTEPTVDGAEAAADEGTDADADAASDEGAAHEIDEIDDDDVTATDVDDLFAKLRSAGSPDARSHDERGAADGMETSEDGEDLPTPFDTRDEALTPLIVASARKLKRVLADEQNSVLDRLRRRDGVRSLDDIVADGAEHGARYFDIIADDLLAAAEAGADSLGGATLDSGDDGVLAPVRVSMLADLVGPLRDRLADRIAAGDGDNEAITKSVRAIYREWKTRHIDDHLDDLLRLAFGRGAFAALDDGEPCRWVVDPAVGPCSDCEDNSLQGDVPAGTAFPTGHVAAPAHAGCRCMILKGEGQSPSPLDPHRR